MKEKSISTIKINVICLTYLIICRDRNLSCRGLIWVIQKPNIKFINAATNSMNNMSQNSLYFPTENQFKNFGHKQLNSLSYGSPENEINHNLSYRGLIWVIQKSNIKLIIVATTSIKNMSPNSLCFPIENQS